MSAPVDPAYRQPAGTAVHGGQGTDVSVFRSASGRTYVGKPGVDFKRSPGGWTGKPGNTLSPSTVEHWNALDIRPGGSPQGYVVYLGEAMRREVTAGEG
jgi:hypothetical protein